MRLAIQLYTLRKLNQPLSTTIEMVSETPFEGVQFAKLDKPPDEVTTALRKTGLATVGAHVSRERLESEFETVRDRYVILGCTDFVVPSYERAAFDSTTAARRAGRRMAALSKRGPDDFTLHYHNHSFEFTDFGDTTGFDAFADAAESVELEIDTGLAHHAGVDPVELIERYGDRISLLHLTDSRRGTDDTLHVDIGEGEVDIEGCVSAARQVDVEWVIFEHGLTDKPIASMERAADRLSPLLEK